MSQLLLLNINDVSEVKYYFTISIFGTSAHFELQTHLMSNAVDWMIRSLFGFKNSKKLSLSLEKNKCCKFVQWNYVFGLRNIFNAWSIHTMFMYLVHKGFYCVRILQHRISAFWTDVCFHRFIASPFLKIDLSLSILV